MSLTLIEVEPATTWLLVRTLPVEVSTIPVPSAVPCWYPSVEMTSTRPGSVWLVTCAVVRVALLPDPDVAHAVPPAAMATAATPAAAMSVRRDLRFLGPLAACAGPPLPPGMPAPGHMAGGGGGGGG